MDLGAQTYPLSAHVPVPRRTCLPPQEARALRYAPAAARAVALRGAFCQGGHVCLVLQRLVPSLLDYVVGLGRAGARAAPGQPACAGAPAAGA